MKNRFSLLHLLCVAAVMGGPCVAPALAQTTKVETTEELQTAQWTKLNQVNSDIEACHVVWHRVRRQHAKPDADPEERAQSMMKWAREKGLSEEKVTQLGDIKRKSTLRSQREEVVESTLDFVRIGNSVLCNAVYLTPEYSERFIEFYDGTHSLHATNEFKGEIRKPKSHLARDPEKILYMSAPGPQLARLLLGIPLDQEFSPDNPTLWQQGAKIQASPNGEWSVTRDKAFIEGESQDPDTLVFGGGGAYLSSYERLGIKSLTMDKDRAIIKIDYEPLNRVVATDFKQYTDGIWFPSKIVDTSFGATTEYMLVEGNFNENVNPFGLTLPPDLQVIDSRFGTGRDAVVYNTTEGRLLTEEELKEKLTRR